MAKSEHTHTPKPIEEGKAATSITTTEMMTHQNQIQESPTEGKCSNI